MTTQNITNITPPRVPLTDERTGLISREWYRFFLNLFNLTGAGSNVTSLTDLQVGPPSVYADEINNSISKAFENVSPSQDGLLAQIAELDKQVQGLAVYDEIPSILSSLAELDKQVQALNLQPVFDSFTASVSTNGGAPVTKTADFTVAIGETWLINNKSGSTCTVTLPAASSYSGRVLYFLNYQTQTLVSASSNVIPLTGGAAGTAILAAVAGDTATLVSDGTNWLMTQYVPNNVLLLE